MPQAKWHGIIDCLVLGLIGVGSMCFIMQGARFAELHINVPGAPVPLFVGEMLLAVCLLLKFVQAYCVRRFFSTRAITVIFLCGGFVILKAAIGYLAYGPLALRHAALFYYPLFAWLVLDSLPVFQVRVWMSYGCLALVLFFFSQHVYVYAIFPLLVLSLWGIYRLPYTWQKAIACVLLAVVLIGHGRLFDDGRTRMIANATGIIVLMIFSFRLWGIPARWKGFIFILMLVLLAIGIGRSADKNSLKSMIQIDILWQRWQEINKYCVVKRSLYKAMSVVPEIFCDNKKGQKCNKFVDETLPKARPKVNPMVFEPDYPLRPKKSVSGSQNQMVSVVSAQQQSGPPALNNNVASVAKENSGHTTTAVSTPALIPVATPVSVPHELRSLQTAQNNIFFRLLIWQDMVVEIVQEHLWIGSSFGYPFRSVSIEALNWAEEIWFNTGWIAPHNSYLSMLYYGGVAGVFMIFFLVSLVVRVWRMCWRYRDIGSILLLAVLLYWLVAAFLGFVLEVPHFAIPFWSLVGVLLYRCREVKKISSSAMTDKTGEP